MRIAIGGVSHETNTFCSQQTTVEDFGRRELSSGPEMLGRHRNVRDYIGGIIDVGERLGIEIVPTFFASAQPSGTISNAAFEELRNRLLTGLRAAGPVDAICLTLHGAGVAEGIDDIEGTLLQDVREEFGPGIPLVSTLDLHANMTHEMLNFSDALLGVNLYPHTDMYDRGVEAIKLTQRLVLGEIKPAMHLTRVPMLIPATTTDLSPAKDVNEICWDWEHEPGVLDCTFYHGFAHTDIPHLSVTVLTITDSDPALARRVSEDVARRIWDIREQFRVTPTSPEETFRQALETEGRPVIINEKADNPGGGGPGDGTHLLRAMLDANLEDACFGFIYDPDTARQAHDAGVGATIEIRLGGKTEPLHGEPIVARAYVKSLTDGKFIQQSPMGQGANVDLGAMARLVIDDIDVIVSSVRTQTLDAEVFLLHGIDVTRYKIVAIKSSAHFRAAFEPIAHKIIRADTPGLVSADLTSFPYRRITRPIWPLDALEWTF